MDEVALKELAELRQRVELIERASGLFADDRDLDGQYGDPQVKFMPRDWRGKNVVGLRFSECPTEFLDMLAESLAWSAANPREGKEKFAKYNAADARRARGWARRIRLGIHTPAERTSSATADTGSPFGASSGSPFDSSTSSPFDSGGGSPFDTPAAAGDDDDIPF